MSLVSCNRPSGDDTEPYGDEAQDDAENDIESRNEKFAILKDPEAFVLKCGEGAITTDKSNGNEITPSGG